MSTGGVITATLLAATCVGCTAAACIVAAQLWAEYQSSRFLRGLLGRDREFRDGLATGVLRAASHSNLRPARGSLRTPPPASASVYRSTNTPRAGLIQLLARSGALRRIA